MTITIYFSSILTYSIFLGAANNNNPTRTHVLGNKQMEFTTPLNFYSTTPFSDITNCMY
nr:hypothetical protein Itr_chr06CG15890 [Ipomoea trifida]